MIAVFVVIFTTFLLVVLKIKQFITLGAAGFILIWLLVLLYNNQAQVLIALVAFFICATLLKAINKKFRPSKKKNTHQRDLVDFIPICGSILLLVIAFSANKFLIFCVVSFGFSDIMGSEIGPLFSGKAYALPSLKEVPHGTSGAVSIAGIIFSIIGSLLISPLYLFFSDSYISIVWLTLIGFISSLFDTILNTSVKSIKFTRKNEIVNLLSCIFSICCGSLILYFVY